MSNMDMSSTETVDSVTRAKTGSGDGREKRNAFILSGAFTAIFTAYLAIQNLQSSLNQEEHLGIISLSSMYACIILSGILAPAVLSLVCEKKIIVFSFFCHVIYTGTNFYPTFATLIPSSVLLGLTAGPMWTSQSVYLSNMAFSYANQHGKDGHTVLSQFNGMFFSMYETTQITGNLISSLVLQQGTYNETDDVNVTKFCGRFDCPLESNSTTTIEEPSMRIVYILLGVFLVLDAAGLLLALCFLPSLEKKREKFQIISAVVSCGRGLTDLNLAMLVPLIMFMAMEQAILWTDYTKAYISCPIGVQRLGFVMAAYGASTTFFALTLSRLSKYTGRYVLFAVAGLVNLGTFITLYVWIPNKDNIVVIFLLPVVWGMSEGIWQTQSNALIAHLFPEKTEAAFANYHTWKAIGFTITFVYSNFLCVSVKLIVAIALLVVSMVLYGVVEVRVKRKQQREEKGHR